MLQISIDKAKHAVLGKLQQHATALCRTVLQITTDTALCCTMLQIIIDIAKHAVLGKFNDIRPGIYREYMRDLCGDSMDHHSHNMHKLVSMMC
jgi:hypothetical protein